MPLLTRVRPEQAPLARRIGTLSKSAYDIVSCDEHGTHILFHGDSYVATFDTIAAANDHITRQEAAGVK